MVGGFEVDREHREGQKKGPVQEVAYAKFASTHLPAHIILRCVQAAHKLPIVVPGANANTHTVGEPTSDISACTCKTGFSLSVKGLSSGRHSLLGFC